MAIEIIVPRLGWSMEEGAFVAWLKKDGEFVPAGEPLFSIEGDKAIQEIESIDSGILRIAANAPKPGDPIRVGDILGHLVPADDVVHQPAPPTAKSASNPATEAPAASESSPARMVPTENAFSPGRAAAISPRALRVAGELGVDWTKLRGSGRSGRIRERDIRAADASTVPGAFSAIGMKRGPSVLVTGGCGFIGTWVVRDLLQRGLRVVVLDAGERPARWERVIGAASEQVPLIRGLLDRELIARVFTEHYVTRVIHLAALLTPACQTDPMEGCRVNVLGSMALFEQIRSASHGIEGFSYASSVAVYGDEPDQAVGSGGKNEPLTFYGAFKKSVEMIAAQYWRHFQIASVGIRPQVAYGPEREVGLTAGPSLAARAAARAEEFCIRYTGRVGYDYVEDVARAFVRGALETPRDAQVVDLAGEVADVQEIIAAIVDVIPEAVGKLTVNGPPLPTHFPPNPRLISTLYPDWKTTSLLEGIRRTVDFYRAGVIPCTHAGTG